MGASIYGLCALAAATCAWLLLRAFLASRARLLGWSSLCFALLALNNVLLAVDLVLWPTIDLLLVRNVTALVAVSSILYGLIGEEG